ncbi:hypothetical protein TNCV_343941 [Trichonephila clavipes]|nr:hypothetical protein TNCV_343941 [Trichonephila clavipes]
MFLAPQYPAFPAECRQMDEPGRMDWTPAIKASFCKTAVGCLPGNSFSRHSSKVTNKLRNTQPSMYDK